MKFALKCLTRYFTCELRERQRYRVEHAKRNSISPTKHVLFCLLYKHLTNKQKQTLFTFQTENTLPFIHGAYGASDVSKADLLSQHK